jgi:hypothetical protein
MTDTQFYILVSVLGVGLAGIGTAIRWSVNRVTKSLDKNSDAMLDNTKSNTKLSTKIDTIFEWMERRGTMPIQNQSKKRGTTNPQGIDIVKNEGEE